MSIIDQIAKEAVREGDANPDLKNEIYELARLAINEIDSGESESNEYDHFLSAVVQLKERKKYTKK